MNDLQDFIGALQELGLPYNHIHLTEVGTVPKTIACSADDVDKVREKLGMYAKIESSWVIRGKDSPITFDWYK